MKSFILRHLSFLVAFALIPEYIQEYFRYIKYSGIFKKLKNEKKLLGNIIAEYHVVEKGLTMPETRLGFGKTKLPVLLDHCTTYWANYNRENDQFQHALKVISEYKAFHEKHDYSLDKGLLDKINHVLELTNNQITCQQISTTKDEYLKHITGNFVDFSNSRRTIRNYSKEPISLDTLRKAVDLAKNTPSSCNRQSTRIYIYEDKTEIKNILEAQGGNRGFGELTDKLIVVTGELEYSHGVYERNLSYVDGGMFTMNLLYGLHYYKIGACPLNCYFSIPKEKKLRALCKIEPSEVFVAMITCGNLPEEFRIAYSPRNDVNTIIKN